jgi:hypothetical protein
MRPNLIMLVVLLGGAAFAQSERRTLETPELLARVLEVARSEVLVVVPSLREPRVAAALHAAAVKRGARVFVIANERWIGEPSSYLGGLSLTKNVQVRLLRDVTQSWAVVDRGLLINGPLLTDEISPLDSRPTTASGNAVLVRRYSSWFTTAWRQAKPYRYSLRER